MNASYYLQAMEIPCWVPRAHAPTTAAKIIEASPMETTATLPWELLAEKVSQCTACGLHKTRTHTVFGIGRRDADLLLIGEAPGAQEDKQGEPFVGRAGQLLNALLTAIDLQRSDVYIANILKCRPPNNRDPKPEEVAQCTPFLERQIALIQPKLIVALGRIAAQFLLRTTQSLSALRGKTLTIGPTHIPLQVTYHPAYLLRTPKDKRKALDDWLQIKAVLQKDSSSS